MKQVYECGEMNVYIENTKTNENNMKVVIFDISADSTEIKQVTIFFFALAS